MKLVIVKLSSIGDIIHTLPALAALRRHFPDADVTWVVERSSAQLLRGNPLLNRLIELDTRQWRRRWRSPSVWSEVMVCFRELRAHQFDIGLDFQGLIKSGLVLYLSGAQQRVGFETACLREKFSLTFLTHQVPASDDVHVIEKNLQLVRSLGAACEGAYEFPLHIADEDRQWVESTLQAHGVKEFAILNPGGAWKGKRWSPAGYAAIGTFLHEAYGLVSVVTHAPDEQMLAQEVVARCRDSVIPLCCTLKQLAALADRASLFVGGDTGPMHLAAARGTPIVAIFGPTVARRNGPFSPEDVIVQQEQRRASAYYQRGQDDDYINVSEDEVRQAIERRLARVSQFGPHKFARTVAAPSG